MAAKGAYTSKPRPVVIMQNTAIRLASIIIVPLTTFDDDSPDMRIPIQPTTENGLAARSFAMCDKIASVPVINLGEEIGRLTEAQMRLIFESLQFLLSDSDELS
jgi:mRNA interferase MazF